MSNAQDYAESLVREIRANVESGGLFGYRECVYADTGEEYREEADPMDWLEDVLDFRYIVTSGREFLGAQLLLAFGGPNAWLDTLTGEISVSWGSESATVYAPKEFTEALNETLEEIWGLGA